MTSKRVSFPTLSLDELDGASGGTWLLDQYLAGRSDQERQATVEWLNQWGDDSNMDGLVGFWFQVEGRPVPQQPAPEPPPPPPPPPEPVFDRHQLEPAPAPEAAAPPPVEEQPQPWIDTWSGAGSQY